MQRIKRSIGQSAVAAAAYRAGEKLYSERYGEDCDYTRKKGVIYTEIILPSHAPIEFANRQTLWNAVETAEKNPKAQLAYSFDIALQNELSFEENKELAIQFCKENLVADGMIVDLCIHSPDKSGGIQNPHFHVLCPMRPLKENGEWGTKQRRVYALATESEMAAASIYSRPKTPPTGTTRKRLNVGGKHGLTSATLNLRIRVWIVELTTEV